MSKAKLVGKLLIGAVAVGAARQSLSSPSRASNSSSFFSIESLARRLALRTGKRENFRGRTYTVTATVYQAVASQTDGKPFLTADNSRIKAHYSSRTHWLALSRDLLANWGGKFHYGDKVHVSGVSPKLDGLYTVHDTMNKRYYHCIDILTHSSEKLSVSSKGVKLRLAPAGSAEAPTPHRSRNRQSTSVARAEAPTPRHGRKQAKEVAKVAKTKTRAGKSVASKKHSSQQLATKRATSKSVASRRLATKHAPSKSVAVKRAAKRTADKRVAGRSSQRRTSRRA
jgi:3D (Asp-Asp-Asp) domain-containing protein